MNDAEARAYAINALAAIARELRDVSAARVSVEPGSWFVAAAPVESLADRTLQAAQRLNEERDSENPAMVELAHLADYLEGVAGRVERLEETCEALARKVIGGPPEAGIVLEDGPELERDERFNPKHEALVDRLGRPQSNEPS